MNVHQLQQHMDEFIRKDSKLAPYAAQGAIKIRLEPSKSEDKIKLALIFISNEARQSGMIHAPGRRVMEQLCTLCSAEGIHIELLARPLPMEHHLGGAFSMIALEKLVVFYQSFGFQALPGQDSRFSRKMLRAAPRQPIILNLGTSGIGSRLPTRKPSGRG